MILAAPAVTQPTAGRRTSHRARNGGRHLHALLPASGYSRQAGLVGGALGAPALLSRKGAGQCQAYGGPEDEMPPMYPPIDPDNYETNVWKTKPSWCQPWSIIGTGVAAVGVSWTLFHAWWLEVPVVLAIGLWWNIFLISYPRMYEDYVLGEVQRLKGGGAPPPPPQN